MRSKDSGAVYRPVIFDLKSQKDQEALSQLMEESANIEVIDEIESQLEEWIKIQQPNKRLEKHEIKQAIALKTASGIYEYGKWIYYPWSGKLIHLLDVEEYAAVRTNRNRNKLTEEEQQRLSTKKVGVVGLSVGKTIAITMAMERSFGEIRLADFDELELSNLNRLQTGIQSLGLPKTVIAAREISEIDPYLRIVCFHEGLTKANMDDFFEKEGKLDMVVDECDSLDIKILLRLKAKDLGIAVLMDMNDRGTLDVERFDLESDRPLLHGMIDHLDLSKIGGLSNIEKIPYILPILGEKTISAKLKASMLEMGYSLSTWPQLSSSVMLGGAIAADTYRRIMLDQFTDSGRYWVDTEEIMKEDEPSKKSAKKSVKIRLNNTDSTHQDILETLVNFPWIHSYRNWLIDWSNDELVIHFQEPEEEWDFKFNLLHLLNAGSFLAHCSENVAFKLKKSGISFKGLDPELTQLRTSAKQVKAVKQIEQFSDLNALKALKENSLIIDDKVELNYLSNLLAEAEKFKYLDENWSGYALDELLNNDCSLNDSEKALLDLSNNLEVIQLLNQWNGGGFFKSWSEQKLKDFDALLILFENLENEENIVILGKNIQELINEGLKNNFLIRDYHTLPLLMYNHLEHSLIKRLQDWLVKIMGTNLPKNKKIAFIGGIKKGINHA